MSSLLDDASLPRAYHRAQRLARHLQQGPQDVATAAPPTPTTALTPHRTLASDEDDLSGRVLDLYRTATSTLEWSEQKHGGQLVAKVLQQHGVRFLTTLSGGHISPVLVACERLGIRIVDVRHEVNAVFAADAISRLTGVPGVAAVTAGPGVTNTVTALKNAQLAESALVLLGGAAATLSKGRGALQDVDQMSVLKSVCKHCVTVTSVRDVVPALRRAFREASSGVPGPVFVELPLDTLYPATEAAAGMGLAERKYRKEVQPADEARVLVPVEYGDARAYLAAKKPLEAVFLRPAKAAQPWLVEQYMRYSLRTLHAGAWDDAEFGPLPVTVPRPAPADVDAVAGLLRQASRPVLLLGSQATLGGPDAVKRLVQAVERLGAPVFLGGMARGLLGARPGSLHVRQERGRALKGADVIVLLGTVCDFRLGYGRELPPLAKCKIVAVNRSRAAATMNSGVFWGYSLAAEADPSLFAQAVAAKVPAGTDARWAPWLAKLRDAQAAKEARNVARAKERAVGRVPKWSKGPTVADDAKGASLLNPLALCKALDDVLPDDAILVADGGDFVATASYIVRPRGPLQWLDPGAFGTLGVGGGFALGAKLVHPEKQVVLLYGDGSCGYSVAEFDTFVRHGLPVLALVGNDAAWTQIEREQVPMFGSDAACALAYCDYDGGARGYGAAGCTVSDPGADLQQVLQRALDAARAGTPFLVNALIGRSTFREGSISV